jgi:hypothetical protein
MTTTIADAVDGATTIAIARAGGARGGGGATTGIGIVVAVAPSTAARMTTAAVVTTAAGGGPRRRSRPPKSAMTGPRGLEVGAVAIDVAIATRDRDTATAVDDRGNLGIRGAGTTAIVAVGTNPPLRRGIVAMSAAAVVAPSSDRFRAATAVARTVAGGRSSARGRDGAGGAIATFPPG